MPTNNKFHSEEYQLLDYDAESLRFATNEYVAEWRAFRLSCNHLVEIGAGIGFQTIAFAKTCKKVTAIELDKKRFSFLEKNLKLLGIKNVTPILGDALSKDILKSIKSANMVFCDPQRLPEEKERAVSGLHPNPNKILDAFDEITDSFAFELPPQIKRIPMQGEKEYISINHKLNRLTLYLGKVKKHDCSVVFLPQKKVISNDLKNKPLKTVKEPETYIYEIEPAIVQAKLLSTFSSFSRLLTKGKPLLTGRQKHFVTGLSGYRVLIISKDKYELKTLIAKLKGDKLVIKYSIDPKKYWSERKELESVLQKQERTLYLFEYESGYLITEKI